MTDINRDYVQRYLTQAENTDNEALKNNALYRVGTHLEVIECNGNDNLTPEQREVVIDAANQFLGGSNNA